MIIASTDFHSQRVSEWLLPVHAANRPAHILSPTPLKGQSFYDGTMMLTQQHWRVRLLQVRVSKGVCHAARIGSNPVNLGICENSRGRAWLFDRNYRDLGCEHVASVWLDAAPMLRDPEASSAKVRA